MRIVCLGDSTTAGSGVPPAQCWVALLRERTGHLWENAGIPGDTLAGMLARLHGEILPRKPDAVLLLGGLNDIMLTGKADQAKPVLMALVNQCAAAGIKPVVGIPYQVTGIPAPWDGLCPWDDARRALDEYIRWLRRMTAAAGLRRVDFDQAFTGSQGLLQPDGMHPSAAGNRVMAQAVLDSGLF